MPGFPLAAKVADSLCGLLDGVAPARIPFPLVDHHVDAVRAIVRENARGEGTSVARTLVTRLVAVSRDFAAAEQTRAESA
jgi:hypothetical protein